MVLYALGSNGHSQLSLGHIEDTDTPAPCLLPPSLLSSSSSSSSSVDGIYCGGNHTLLITSSGGLFAAGSNEFHQLGIPSTSQLLLDGNLVHFTQIHQVEGEQEDGGWRSAACGFNSSILLSRGGHLYVCGTCEKGGLGLGATVHHAPTLTPLNLPVRGGRRRRRVVRIEASISFAMALCEDGTVLGWGSARKGQLGRRDRNVLHEPTVLCDLAGDGDVPRSLTLGKDWSVVVLGSSVRFLGQGNVRYPIDVESVDGVGRVIKVCSNWSTLHLLMQSGAVQSLGRHDRGQFAPRGLPPLKALVSGTEHCVGIGRDDGKVYAWGWNEHGNCGPGKEDVTGVRTLSIGDEPVKGIAAGYGTTFVWC